MDSFPKIVSSSGMGLFLSEGYKEATFSSIFQKTVRSIEYRDTAINRDELCQILEKKHQYAKNKLFNEVINDKLQTTAIRNAKKLLQSWVSNSSQGKTDPATDNPSTTVHELVELLNGFRSKNDIE